MATAKKLVQETREEKAARELAEYKLLLAEKDHRRTKTFMLACYTGNVEKIIECMKENVNVDASDERGQTGLFYAISSGQPNSSFVNRIGETAKSMAERLGNDLCKEAIDNYTGEYDTDSDEDDFFQ